MSVKEQCINIPRKEIIIFKYAKNTYISYDTHYQVPFTFTSGGILDGNTSNIINDNGEKQNKYIDRNKIHVENATGNKQVKPPEFMRKQKINDRN